jgi:hypothetical protein
MTWQDLKVDLYGPEPNCPNCGDVGCPHCEPDIDVSDEDLMAAAEFFDSLDFEELG